MNTETGPDYEMYGEPSDSERVRTDVQLQHRATREFVPADKKDEKYWFKRVRNNASARKSRMKRKALDKVMEKKLMGLEKENQQLKNELAAVNIMLLQSRGSGNLGSNITQEHQRQGSQQTTRDDKSDNGSTCETGSTSTDQDDHGSNSSGKSEMDDFRHEVDSPPVTDSYLKSHSALSIFHGVYSPMCTSSNIGIFSHPRAIEHLKAISQRFCQSAGYMTFPQAMMGLQSEIPLFPYMIPSNIGDEDKRENYDSKQGKTDVKRIPHKIRIKERVHSAFN